MTTGLEPENKSAETGVGRMLVEGVGHRKGEKEETTFFLLYFRAK